MNAGDIKPEQANCDILIQKRHEMTHMGSKLLIFSKSIHLTLPIHQNKLCFPKYVIILGIPISYINLQPIIL